MRGGAHRRSVRAVRSRTLRASAGAARPRYHFRGNIGVGQSTWGGHVVGLRGLYGIETELSPPPEGMRHRAGGPCSMVYVSIDRVG